MKKLLTALLALVLVFSLVACGGNSGSKDSGSSATTLTGSAKGFAGDVKVTVTKEGDKITKLEVEESETPDIGGTALKDLVAKVLETGSVDGVEVVSGATVSSEAFLKAVKEAK